MEGAGQIWRGQQILKACKTGIYQKALVRDGQQETLWHILIFDPIKSIKQAMKDVVLKGKMVCLIFSPLFQSGCGCEQWKHGTPSDEAVYGSGPYS